MSTDQHDTRTLSGFLAMYAADAPVVDLTSTGQSAYLVVRIGSTTAVVNVDDAGDHLWVGVRGYVGDAEYGSRVVAFPDDGARSFRMTPPDGTTWPLVAVVVGERQREAAMRR